MKILNLIIKQKYFDAIMAGRKRQEFREVRPTTVKKLLQLDDEGYEIVDEYDNAQPIQYDAIRFFVGYNKDRDSALVEVESAYCEIFTSEIKNPDGSVMLFEADKDGNPLFFKRTDSGWVFDENGKKILDPENGHPCPAREGGVPIEMPIEYEYDGRTWVAEQVVYNLGKIIETDIKPKVKKI